MSTPTQDLHCPVLELLLLPEAALWPSASLDQFYPENNLPLLTASQGDGLAALTSNLQVGGQLVAAMDLPSHI